MSVICQKSPCTPLTNAIGAWVEVTITGWFQQVKTFKGEIHSIRLIYCPFCGTHLNEIHDERIVARIQRPAIEKPKPVLKSIPVPRALAAEGALGAPFSLLPPPPPPPRGLKPGTARKRSS